MAGTILLGKEPFNFYTPPPQLSQITPTSFTGQDILDAVNKYRKENNKPVPFYDEQVCKIEERIAKIKEAFSINLDDHKDLWPKSITFSSKPFFLKLKANSGKKSSVNLVK